MEIELKGKHTVVCGAKGEGKSNFVNYLLGKRKYKNHVIVDPMREHKDLNRYTPRYRRGKRAWAELDGFLDRMVIDNDREMRPEIVGLDEANRYTKKRGELSGPVGELVDLSRHYGVGSVLVARRPVQLHTDILELADNQVFFRLVGKNDVRYLDDLAEGLGDTVRNLDKYHFVVKKGVDYKAHSPVAERSTTGRL